MIKLLGYLNYYLIYKCVCVCISFFLETKNKGKKITENWTMWLSQSTVVRFSKRKRKKKHRTLWWIILIDWYHNKKICCCFFFLIFCCCCCYFCLKLIWSIFLNELIFALSFYFFEEFHVQYGFLIFRSTFLWFEFKWQGHANWID